MTSMIERLPLDLFGAVLIQLSQVTSIQKQPCVNDLPILMRNISRLSVTSKTLHYHFNTDKMTQMILDFLSGKYEFSKDYFASLLNSSGSRRWLWNHIQTNGDLEIYQEIQKIFSIEMKLIGGENEKKKDSGLDDGLKYFPSPDFGSIQTKHGIAFCANPHLSYLVTPFGKISIHNMGIYSGQNAISISTKVISKLHHRLQAINFSIDRKEKRYELKTGRQDISRDRSDSIICARCGDFNCYEIQQIGDKRLPNLVWHQTDKTIRVPKVLNRTWEILKSKSVK